MPSIAEAYMRLRIDPSQVKRDAESGLSRVDTRKAGQAAGKQYGSEFAGQLNRDGGKAGDDLARSVNRGINARRGLIVASARTVGAGFGGELTRLGPAQGANLVEGVNRGIAGRRGLINAGGRSLSGEFGNGFTRTGVDHGGGFALAAARGIESKRGLFGGAGGRAGNVFRDSFGGAVSRIGSTLSPASASLSKFGDGEKSGGNFANNFAKGFTFKRSAIGLAITAALAVGPAGIALAGAALGLGFAAAAGAAIYKNLSKQLKAANKDLATAQKSGNQAAIASAKEQVASLTKQLAAYQGVKIAVQDVRDTLIQVGNKALVSSGFLTALAKGVTQFGQWIKAHQQIFTELFRAASPYVSIFIKFFEHLIEKLLPAFTGLMRTAQPAVQRVLDSLIKFVSTGIVPFLKSMGQGAGSSAKAFGNLLVALRPLFPIVAKVAVGVASMVAKFPILIPLVAGAVVAFRGMLVIGAVVNAAKGVGPLIGLFGKLNGALLLTRVQMGLLYVKIIAVRAAQFIAAAATVAWTAAQWLLNIALNANPLVLVTLAALALGAAAFLIIKYWKPVFSFFKNNWKTILTVMFPIIGLIVSHWRGVASFFVGLWNGIKSVAITVWNAISGFFAQVDAKIIGGLRAAWGGISRFFSSVWNGIRSIFTTVVGAISGFLARTWTNISNGVKSAWNAVVHFFGSTWTNISNGVKSAWNAVAHFFGSLWTNVSNGIKSAWNAVSHFFGSTWTNISNGVKSAWNAVAHFFGSLWTNVSNGIKSAWNAVSHFFGSTWTNISNGIKSAWNAVAHFFGSLWTNVSNGVKSAWNAVSHFFGSTWTNISNGIKSAWNAVLHFFGSLWTNIFNGVKSAWNSVSHFFSSTWTNISNAITTAWHTVQNFFGSTWTNIYNGVRSAWNTIIHFFQTTWDTIKGVFTTVIGTISNALATAWSVIHGAAVIAWNAIVGVISGIWNGIVRVVKVPIRLVVSGYNAFASAVNFIANKVFGQHIDAQIHLPKGFKSGGLVTDGTHETADDVLVRVSKKETIVSAAHSRILAPAFSAVGVPGYAKGGVPSLGAYRNPLAGATYNPTRIDQGVDFQGHGPLSAIGAGRTILTNGGGWPGGPFMSYKLTAGPLAGANVFYAENIRPLVRPGQSFKAGQHIADMFFDGTGIEMGFANSSGTSTLSQTADAGGIGGNKLNQPGGTQVGQLFEELLMGLGVKRSFNQGMPAGGKVPGNLPGGAGWSGFINAIKKGGSFVFQAAINSIGDLLGQPDLAKKIGGPLSGALNIANKGIGGLEKFVAGKGMFLPSLVGSGLSKVGGWATSWLNDKVLNKVASLFGIDLSGTPGGGGPVGATNGSSTQNGVAIYKYLLSNLFHGNKFAAAGAIASMWGESSPPGWNPESRGSGGFGIMGWTPGFPGVPPAPTGNAAKDIKAQIAHIIPWLQGSGDIPGRVGQVARARSVAQGANLWGTLIERFGKNDVHPEGISAATAIMNKNAYGGTLRDTVYGLDAGGKTYSFAENGPERIVPGGSDPLLSELRALRRALEDHPARTAAGVAKAIKAPAGQEATAARLGARG